MQAVVRSMGIINTLETVHEIEVNLFSCFGVLYVVIEIY
jgi:hypothetical protein